LLPSAVAPRVPGRAHTRLLRRGFDHQVGDAGEGQGMATRAPRSRISAR